MGEQSSEPTGVMTVQELHRQLYGTLPRKPGIAYERLAAAVFAHLGWVDVEHDQFESTPAGSAEHQLDFVCRHPDGSVTRLMAQCKHWMRKVRKQEMDTLFGVQTQLGWDAAVVITQVGFTRGARRVAADQGIAMVILRPYEPAMDDGRWWRGARTTISWPFVSVTDVKLHPANPADARALHGLRIEPWMSLWHGPAKEAERFDELWQKASAERQSDGTLSGSVAFDEARSVLGTDERLIPVTGMEWTVRVDQRDIVSTVEAAGTPVFWLEQLGDKGEVTLGRVITDQQLKLWDFDGKRLVRNVLPDRSVAYGSTATSPLER